MHRDALANTDTPRCDFFDRSDARHRERRGAKRCEDGFARRSIHEVMKGRQEHRDTIARDDNRRHERRPVVGCGPARTAAELPAWRTGFGEVQAIVQHRRPGLASFAQMEKEEQADLLLALEHARSGFFQLVIIATLQGMFSNPGYGGNHDKLGWQLLGFQDRFVWSAPFGDYDRE